jgi:hypothetical protein
MERSFAASFSWLLPFSTAHSLPTSAVLIFRNTLLTHASSHTHTRARHSPTFSRSAEGSPAGYDADAIAMPADQDVVSSAIHSETDEPSQPE